MQACSDVQLTDSDFALVVAQRKVDRVLLVGGATRMAKIRQMMRDHFDKEPDCDFKVDEVLDNPHFSC